MKEKIVQHKCPECGCDKARLIDTCIIYDKYYICKNPKCGYSDFNDSKELTPEEDAERKRKLDEELETYRNRNKSMKVQFT